MPMTSPHSKSPVLASFGAAVRVARASAGTSQKDLANRSDIDRSYLGAIERGDQNPGLLHIARIAAALDTSVMELMKNSGL